MTELKVWTFFYGSYMNLEVLKEVGLKPEQYEVAKLSGFDIEILPLANLVRSNKHCVYGIIASTTHEQLKLLYAHAQNVLGGTYLPEAVLVETLDGKLKPVMCYISSTIKPASAANDYIDKIVKAASEFKFPRWYINRLESFRS